MANEAPLKPVFVPALAELLAHAEKSKGSALTEAEAHCVRDQGTCVMMSAEHAQQMEKSRGFRDVNPENCLAHWNRMRVQFTGRGYLPKLILCVPGDDHFRAKCEPILLQAGVEHEFRGHDSRMVKAFGVSKSYLRPSLDIRDFEAIALHSTVLYVLSENFAHQQAAATSGNFMQLGRNLLGAGGIGIKCESSGIAHSASFWQKLSDQAGPRADSDSFPSPEFWAAAFAAYVQFPIQSTADYYSCGMHLLGQPDMIVSRTLMNAGESPANQAAELFDGFGVYLLSEVDEEGFTSGHTFSLTSEARRYRVIWEPCTGYDEDEFFFNPYGRWRFVDP